MSSSVSELSAPLSIEQLQTTILQALQDIKAQDIQIFTTDHLTPFFERCIIATATSGRQVYALAHHVCMQVKAHGGDIIGIEGEQTKEWILVDCNTAIVHIMQPEIRNYYRLEELWGRRTDGLNI